MFFGPLALEYLGGAGTVEKLVTGTPIAQKIIEKTNTQTVQIGEEFGKLGTYVGENHPNLTVNWSSMNNGSHAFIRMIERGVSKADVEYFISNGKVLEQSGGKYAYITERGMAVINEKGILITTYSSKYYDETMKKVVEKLFGK